MYEAIPYAKRLRGDPTDIGLDKTLPMEAGGCDSASIQGFSKNWP